MLSAEVIDCHERLARNKDMLVDSVDVGELLPLMANQLTLLPVESQAVSDATSLDEGAAMLINFLMKKSARAYRSFRKALLESHNADIVETLDTTPMDGDYISSG